MDPLLAQILKARQPQTKPEPRPVIYVSLPAEFADRLGKAIQIPDSHVTVEPAHVNVEPAQINVQPAPVHVQPSSPDVHVHPRIDVKMPERNITFERDDMGRVKQAKVNNG